MVMCLGDTTPSVPFPSFSFFTLFTSLFHRFYYMPCLHFTAFPYHII